MKVSELEKGQIYKIRSDRATHVRIVLGFLDIHVDNGHFRNKAKLRPCSVITYLGKDSFGTRFVLFQGKKLRAHQNIWQHIVPIDHDNP